MDDRDIVDEIDALVDEQLQQERSGYDHNINQEHCPHCGRHWHGLPLTAMVALMYAAGTYDPEYSVAEDDSPIICPGSGFIGPIPPSWADELVKSFTAWICDVQYMGYGEAHQCARERVLRENTPRGHEVDLIQFDEVRDWLAPPTRPTFFKQIAGWSSVWLVGFVSVWMLSDWWALSAAALQWFAIWRIYRVGRRNRRRQPSMVMEWPRHYTGPMIGFDPSAPTWFDGAMHPSGRSGNGS